MPDSLRPHESGHEQLDLLSARSTYRALVNKIVSISTAPEHANLPAAAAYIRDQIDDFRIHVLDSNDPEQLKSRISSDSTLRLAHIPIGSVVLVVVHAGSESTSIKYLNDTFGPNITNAIIDKRDELLFLRLEYYQLADRSSVIDNGYKIARYSIDRNRLPKALEKLETRLNAEALARNHFDPEGNNDLAVINYVLALVENDTKSAIRSFLEDETRRLRENDPQSTQANKIEEWLATQLQYFTLNFGFSDPVNTPTSTRNGLEQRVWTSKQSEWIARASSQRYTNGTKVVERRLRGGAFNLQGLVNDIQKGRNEALEDESLVDFFEMVQDPTLGDVLLLKADVVNNLRKWANFKAVHATDIDLIARYEKLRRYYQTINAIDYIFPWASIDDAQAVIQDTEDLLQTNDIADLKNALLYDERDKRDCTESYFHYQGTEYSEAFYVSLDAIGIGNMNVRDFEKISLRLLKQNKSTTTQPLANSKDNARKLLMEVGNTVTKLIQDKIDEARELLAQELPGIQFYSMRGGDEWTVMIPAQSGLLPEDVYRVTCKISDTTDFRASVSHKKSSAVIDNDQRILDHYQALDTNAKNNAFIKELESLGLKNIVAIPGENNHTAAIFPHPSIPNQSIIVDKIGAVLAAAKGLKLKKIPITIATVVAVLSSYEK